MPSRYQNGLRHLIFEKRKAILDLRERSLLLKRTVLLRAIMKSWLYLSLNNLKKEFVPHQDKTTLNRRSMVLM